MRSEQNTPVGTVTGHVYYADSNIPARLARLELFSLPSDKGQASKPKSKPFLLFDTRSRTDGSFTFANVPPGEYFVSAKYSGYLAPEWRFGSEALRDPTLEQRAELIKTIPNVSVTAGKSVNVDIHLERGGSISGTVRFEDGAPFAEAEVTAFRRDLKGKWNSLEGQYLHPTDDLGRFRLSSVPPGEYIIAVEMSLQDAFGKWSGETRRVYYGDAFMERDAKTFKITEGEDIQDIDISIQLSKLHSVSGYLLDQTGQIVNSGEVALFTIPDQIEVARAQVGADDSTFHFDFIPDRRYLLRVINPRNVSRQALLPPVGFVQIPAVKETVIKIFKPYEAPVDIFTDLPNLNISVQAIGPNKE